VPVDLTIWAWLGLFAMLAGTAPPLWVWFTRPGEERPGEPKHYATLAGITGIAAVAYLFMALDVGAVATDGGTLQVARYVDWLLTTPLLLLYLVLLVRPTRRVLAVLIAVDVVVIVAGTVAVVTTGLVSWAAFGVGVVAYLGLVYGLLVKLPAAASTSDDRVQAVFGTLRNITVVLWTLYPLVWILAPTGLGILTTSTEMLVFVYLDVVSKVGFVVVAVAGIDALAHLRTDAARSTEPSQPSAHLPSSDGVTEGSGGRAD